MSKNRTYSYIKSEEDLSEIWVPVVGWEDYYEVNELGIIARLEQVDGIWVRYPLKQTMHVHYLVVLLSADGCAKTIPVHTIVAAAFHGPRPQGLIIDHVDEDHTNNRATNLQYITTRENVLKSKRRLADVSIPLFDQIPATRYNDIFRGLRALKSIEAIVSMVMPGSLSASKENVGTYCFAMVAEIIEISKEFEWRSWRERPKVNAEALAEEIADLLAFLGIILNYAENAGVSPSDIAMAFKNKSRRNIDRLSAQIVGFQPEGTGS